MMSREQLLKDLLANEIRRKIKALDREHATLCELYCDVTNYNAKIAQGSGTAMLHGYSTHSYLHRGHVVETGYFPLYYFGDVSGAPPCPSAIVMSEIVDVAKERATLFDAVCAVYTYSPGGFHYETLRRRTRVGKNSDSNSMCDGT